MFSRLQAMRPGGKRSVSHANESVDERSGTSKEQDIYPGRVEPTGYDSIPSNQHLASGPPMLPPIPRVASQYGNQSPVLLGNLEEKLRNVGTEEDSKPRPAQEPLSTKTTDSSSKAPSDLPFRRDEHSARPKSYSQQHSARSNFSRPLQPPSKSKSHPESPPKSPSKGRSQTDSTMKPSSFPKPPSKERPTQTRPPVREGPRPPSTLRESFTAEPVGPVKDSRPIPPPSAPPIPQTLPRAEAPFSPPQPTMRPKSSGGSSTAFTSSTTSAQPSKSSSMLNRLNPMAFLGRRRSTQPEQPTPDVPAQQKRGALLTGSPLPDDFDPRIRGKVVHDFSAPRTRRFASSQDLKKSKHDSEKLSSLHETRVDGKHESRQSHLSPARGSEADKPHTPVFREHFDEEIDGVWRYDQDDPRNKVTTKILQHMPANDLDQNGPLPPFGKKSAERSAEISAGANVSPAVSNSPFSPQNHFSPQSPAGPSSEQSLDSAGRLQSNTTSPITPATNSRDLQARPEGLNEVNSPSSPNAQLQSPVATTQDQQATPEVLDDASSKSSQRDEDTRADQGTDADTSFEELAMQGANLPKHMKSNASRFSFDLAGVGSAAQEKLLEDRHRQKQAQRTRASTVSAASIAETNEEYDYDDMDMDDGGFEEDFPGMNDEDHFSGFSGVANMTLGSLPTQETSDSPAPAFPSSFNLSQPLQPLPDALGVYQTSPPSQDLSRKAGQETPTQEVAQPKGLNIHQGMSLQSNNMTSYEDDDDLYFDDGMIDIGEPTGETFDESVFDDEESSVYGRPLRDQTRPPTNLQDVTDVSSQQSTRPLSSESIALANQAGATADTSRTSVQPEKPLPVPKSSLVGRDQSKHGQLMGLTHDNLAAYHDALALAANRAASEGRFDRRLSIDSVAKGTDNMVKRADSITKGAEVAEPSRVSFNDQEFGANMRPLSDDSGFKFDDDFGDMDDDEFVAAANAEALENDDEGFYGREFGFYARANDADTEQYTNGGYFGQGQEALKRSHSGRAGGQDPSLTPITERSEWSQRNSMISLVHAGSYPASVPGQGLAQLADALQHEDQDDMSLSGLMKLRRGAWGSSTSLHSTGTHNSVTSPQMNTLSPPPIYGFSSPPLSAGINAPGLQSGGGPASISVPAYYPMSPPGMLTSPNISSPLSTTSPTAIKQPLSSPLPLSTTLPLTSPAPQLSTQDVALSPTHPRSAGSDTSPKRHSALNKGHSRNSSGAESVSYFKEDDLDQDRPGRWVMERRRTGEGGMEVVDRQFIEGGI